MHLFFPLRTRAQQRDADLAVGPLQHQDFSDVLLPILMAVSVFAGVETSSSLLFLIPLVSLTVLAMFAGTGGINLGGARNLFFGLRGVFFAFIALYIVLFGLDPNSNNNEDQGEERTCEASDIFSWFEFLFFGTFCFTTLVLHHWLTLYHALPRGARQVFRQVFIHRLRWLDSIPGPAGMDIIESLPLVVIGNSSNNCCSICLEDFVCGDRANVLRCKHVFHPACLTPWLMMKSTCPVCRACVDDGAGDVCEYDDGRRRGTQEQQPRPVAWLALQRVMDPELALDLRLETRASLRLVTLEQLVINARARGIRAASEDGQSANKEQIIQALLGNNPVNGM